jgi:dolichol-phosphate mannosyltransferase
VQHRLSDNNYRTLVIIPTYNERDNIRRLIPAVLERAPSLEVLVVDDGSPDGTGRVVESLAEKDRRVRILHRPDKQGLGRAYVAGFRYALAGSYQYIIQMDGDFSHRPEDLPRLLWAAKDADLVIGSRSVPGGRVENWAFLRQLVSKGGSLYARILLGLPIRDCTSGFKCFRRRVLEAIDLGNVQANGYGFQVEINYLCHLAGFHIAEVPIVFPDRIAGRSKMNWQIALEAAALVWRLRLRNVSMHLGGNQPVQEPFTNDEHHAVAAVPEAPPEKMMRR